MSGQKVYVGQTALIIRLETLVDLSDAAEVKIRYLRPQSSMAVGEWMAEIYDVSKGIIQYRIQSAEDLDQVGDWTCWAYITFKNEMVAMGQPAGFTVYPEGK
jgi:hypothetical protein